jgi:hypothetical protein
LLYVLFGGSFSSCFYFISSLLFLIFRGEVFSGDYEGIFPIFKELLLGLAAAAAATDFETPSVSSIKF